MQRLLTRNVAIPAIASVRALSAYAREPASEGPRLPRHRPVLPLAQPACRRKRAAGPLAPYHAWNRFQNHRWGDLALIAG